MPLTSGTIVEYNAANHSATVKIKDDPTKLTDYLPIMAPAAGGDCGAQLSPYPGDWCWVSFRGSNRAVISSANSSIIGFGTAGAGVPPGKKDTITWVCNGYTVQLDDAAEAITVTGNGIKIELTSGGINIEATGHITIETDDCTLTAPDIALTATGDFTLGCTEGGDVIQLKSGTMDAKGGSNLALSAPTIKSAASGRTGLYSTANSVEIAAGQVTFNGTKGLLIKSSSNKLSGGSVKLYGASTTLAGE